MSSDQIHERSDGRFVVAQQITTKKRFRSTLTEDFLPVEAHSVDALSKARSYVSRESAKRAIRKFKNKL